MPANIITYALYANRPQSIVIICPPCFPPMAILSSCGFSIFLSLTINNALAPQKPISRQASTNPTKPIYPKAPKKVIISLPVAKPAPIIAERYNMPTTKEFLITNIPF